MAASYLPLPDTAIDPLDHDAPRHLGPCGEPNKHATQLAGNRPLPLGIGLRHHVGHAHERWKRGGPHLFHDVASMDLRRDLCDAERRRDLLVEKPSHHESHYLALPASQRGKAYPDRRAARASLAGPLIALD